MRLTVHVKGAKKEITEVKTKDGGVKKITRMMTTLSYLGVEERDVSEILARIVSNEQGTPVKHYLSNDRPIGRSRVRKKK